MGGSSSGYDDDDGVVGYGGILIDSGTDFPHDWEVLSLHHDQVIEENQLLPPSDIAIQTEEEEEEEEEEIPLSNTIANPTCNLSEGTSVISNRNRHILDDPFAISNPNRHILNDPVTTSNTNCKLSGDPITIADPNRSLLEGPIVSSGPNHKLPEDRIMITNANCKLPEDWIAINNLNNKFLEDEIAITGPNRRLLEERAMDSNSNLKLSEGQALISIPNHKFPEDLTVITNPNHEITKEQISISNPDHEFSEEQVMINNPDCEFSGDWNAIKNPDRGLLGNDEDIESVSSSHAFVLHSEGEILELGVPEQFEGQQIKEEKKKGPEMLTLTGFSAAVDKVLSMIWWKQYSSRSSSSPIRTDSVLPFALAATVVGVAVLGYRWHRERRQNQQLWRIFHEKDEKINELMNQLIRMKDALAARQQVPVIKLGIHPSRFIGY